MRTIGALALLLVAVTAPAQTLDDLREEVRAAARASRFPLFVAAFLDLAGESDLAGGHFRIEGRPDTDLTLFTLPWRAQLGRGDEPHFLVEAAGGYARARLDVPDIWDGGLPGLETRVEATYQALGGFVGGGPVLPVGGSWRLVPEAAGGLAHVDSDVLYSGPGAGISAALFDDILFRWDAWYAVYGATAMLVRAEPWQFGDVEVSPLVRYDLRRVDPFAASDRAQDEVSTVQTLVGRLGFEGPTGWTCGGTEVRWLGDVGGKVIDAESASALGFHGFAEIGGGLRFGLSGLLSWLEAGELRAAVFFGDDVFGWTIGGSVTF